MKKSFEQIIDSFEIDVLSGIVGVPIGHIRVWKIRDSIPMEYWTAILESKENGIGLQQLTRKDLEKLRANRFSPKYSGHGRMK